jgi:hypothetical protein
MRDYPPRTKYLARRRKADASSLSSLTTTLTSCDILAGANPDMTLERRKFKNGMATKASTYFKALKKDVV